MHPVNVGCAPRTKMERCDLRRNKTKDGYVRGVGNGAYKSTWLFMFMGVETIGA